MFNQYFGHYLLSKQLLSPAQLYDILARERSIRPKLGVFAIDAGLMTAAMVEEVHLLQRRMDKRFGEIARERGYLTARQLEDLLATQKFKRLSLSQAIVDNGILSLASLEKELANYKRDCQLSAVQLDALHNADIDVIVRSFLDFSSAGQRADLLYEYVALIIRHFIRFCGEEPVIAAGTPTGGWLMAQEMTGEINISTGLAMNGSLLVKLARLYSGEPIDEVNELATDSIAAFLNEANGIFAVNLADQGIKLDLKPLQSQPIEGVLPLQNHYRVSFHLAGGHADLYLALT